MDFHRADNMHIPIVPPQTMSLPSPLDCDDIDNYVPPLTFHPDCKPSPPQCPPSGSLSSVTTNWNRSSSSTVRDRSSSPISADPRNLPPTISTAILSDDIIAYLQDPLPETDLFRHPVNPDQFWGIWCGELADELEGCSVTYNSKTLTLQIQRMSFGLHNVGSKWLKSGWRKMQGIGLVAPEDLADLAFGAFTKVGLIEEPDNKAYEGFDESTPWNDMTRTPDWSITRICDDLASEKPLIVMEIGVSQPLQKSTKSKSKRESLHDRAEGWLLASHGITKAVVLIDLSNCKRPTDADPELLDTSCLLVTVELWRLDPDPTPVEHHEFTVCQDSAAWIEADVPDAFPKGITFTSGDIYDTLTTQQSEKTFVLPLWWLRNEVINTWKVHTEAAGKRRRKRTRDQEVMTGRDVSKRLMREV